MTKTKCPVCGTKDVSVTMGDFNCNECTEEWTKAQERERLKPLMARTKKRAYDKARALAKKAAKAAAIN